MESGDYQFDVGLDDNWRWHRHRFSDLWDALDPYMNRQRQPHHTEHERPSVFLGSCHWLLSQTRTEILDKRIAANYRESYETGRTSERASLGSDDELGDSGTSPKASPET